MENKRKVYISLPISGYDIDERRDTAMKMEIRLRGCGAFSSYGYDLVCNGAFTKVC